MRTLAIGIALMVVAILLSLVATTERIDRFDRSYEASGAIDLRDERSFLEQRNAIESKISITGEEIVKVTITYEGQSVNISTKDLELSYIPDAISLSDAALYECTITASAGKPYLFLSFPALLCSLLGFGLVFASIAKKLRK
ncbi:MAG: hypothetical protein SVE93_01585 [Candidatus Thermoplasmatota archaeon]|nr:hypothetical protein [Candidatus Thermoplasmatota archaeon]